MKRVLQLLFFLALVALVLWFTGVSHEARFESIQGDRPVELVRRDSSGVDGERGMDWSFKYGRTPGATPDRKVVGLVSATEDRARDDARRVLREAVAAWLAPQVPPSWRAPTDLVDGMIKETRIIPEEKPYGVVYTAALDVDFSGEHRDRLVDSYRRDVAHDRALKLGAALGFLLICLAATSGYIRADEATRGYYTNRLRLAAAAAVGASGVVIYQLLV